MNLLTALVPLGLAMLTGGGEGNKKTDSKLAAESFLLASGAIEKSDMKNVQPFMGAPEAGRPRGIQEITRGSPTTKPYMDPIQRIVQSDPRVASAVSRMLTESSNQQMRDFSAKYATRVTTPQGRKTLATKQPGDIKVGV